MRWPLRPPHLTLKPSKTRKKRGKTRTNKKYSKMSFSAISQNFPFWVGVQNFPFLTTWPKKRAPPKHHKIGVSANFVLKKTYASRNGLFWTKKTKSRNSSYHLFMPIFFSFNHKNTKNAETPIV